MRLPTQDSNSILAVHEAGQHSTAQHMRKQGNKAALAPTILGCFYGSCYDTQRQRLFFRSFLAPLPPVLSPNLAFRVCTELFALINMAKHAGVCHTAGIALLPVM